MLFDALGDETRVGQEAEAEDAVGNDEADRIDGIVLDSKAADGEVVNRKLLSGLEGDPIGVTDIRFTDDVGRFCRGVEWDRIFFDEIFQPADVIAVFVGEKDGGNGCGIDVERLEADAELFGREPCIDENAGGAAFDDGGVTG